jgi:hypothetical protein
MLADFVKVPEALPRRTSQLGQLTVLMFEHVLISHQQIGEAVLIHIDRDAEDPVWTVRTWARPFCVPTVIDAAWLNVPLPAPLKRSSCCEARARSSLPSPLKSAVLRELALGSSAE